MEPDTYVRPHRHMQSWELLIPLSGSFLLTVFDEAGATVERHRLGGVDGLSAVEFPAGTWHTVTSLGEGSVIFEVKEGPYLPVQPADLADWSPAEGTPEAADFVRQMHAEAKAMHHTA